MSNIFEGIQGYQQARYDAEVAKANINIAEQNAARSRLEAGLAEETKRRETRMDMGRAAAAGAQSGVAGGGMGAGSVGAVLKQSAINHELDALNIRYGGQLEQGAHLAEAEMFRAERKAATKRGKAALAIGVMKQIEAAAAASMGVPAGGGGGSSYTGGMKMPWARPRTTSPFEAPNSRRRTSSGRSRTPRPSYGEY